LEKTPELRDRLTMLLMVGKRASRHCFRKEVGIGSRSHKVMSDCEMSLQISSLVAGLKKEKLVGTRLGSRCCRSATRELNEVL